MNMGSCCDFCYYTLSIIREIGPPELRWRLGAIYESRSPDRFYELRHVYDELSDAIITHLGIWASFGPREDMTVGLAGLADGLHSAIHRILFRHIDEILAFARVEVDARAEGYDVGPAEAADRIQDMIDRVDDIVDRERRHHSS
jgi:hypothetical protein